MSSETQSVYSYEKSTTPLLGCQPTRGTYKIKYQGDSSEWDMHLDAVDAPIDLSLNLPHYRARYQPVDHRMSMFVGGEREPIKLKLCRTVANCNKFYLEVQAVSSDVTIWLPSDFKGKIHYGGKAIFSAGFVNRVLRNVRANVDGVKRLCEDEVVVVTRGTVTFKMWDVETGSPESCTKESFKRFFGCSRKTPITTIDWDCLVRE